MLGLGFGLGLGLLSLSHSLTRSLAHSLFLSIFLSHSIELSSEANRSELLRQEEQNQVKEKDFVKKIEKLVLDHTEAMELERANSLKNYEEKWRKAMKKTEKWMSKTLGEAVSKALEDKEAELRIEMALTTSDLKVATELVYEEQLKDVLSKVQRQHEEKISMLKIQTDAEREESVLRAENFLKEQLNEEWMVRLKLGVDEAWKQSKSAGKLEVLERDHALENVELKIVELRGIWEIEMAQQLVERGVLAEKVLAEQLHEQAVAMEAERSRGLKLEASKWKQALKEAEKRLVLEVNHAKMDAREEREREVQIEIAAFTSKGQLTSEEHLRAIESAHREYNDKIERLQTLLTEEKSSAALAEERFKESLIFSDEKWVLKMKAATEEFSKLKLEEELRQVNEKALVVALETEKGQLFKEETSKWRKALKMADKRLKEAEADTVSKSNGKELELSQLHAQSQREREEAVLHAENILRDQLSEEWMARLKLEVDAAREQSIMASTQADKLDTHQNQQRLGLNSDSEATEQRIRVLRELWEAETAQQLLLKERENEEEVLIKLREQAVTMEAERTRGLKLEASKWKQALKEAEKRLALEVNQARIDAREERERELEGELNAAESKEKVAVQVAVQLANDHFSQAAEVAGKEHSNYIIQLQKENKIEREEAVLRAESVLKEELSEEWMVRLKQEVDRAWESSTVAGKNKLSRNQEALENFKRDVTAQGQRMATERNELQERVDQSEFDFKKLEGILKEEREKGFNFDANRKKTDYETAERHQAEVDRLIFDINESKVALIELEKAHDNRLREGTQSLNSQLEAVHTNSINQISELEREINDLKKDKSALAVDLLAAASRLEDEARSKIDLLRKIEEKTREFSLFSWKMAIGARKLRASHEGVFENSKKLTIVSEEKSKKMREKFDNALLTILQLSSVLQSIEDLRMKEKETIVSYRVNDLNDKKTIVRGLERELEQLGVEKDSLEEQRDDMEDEIEQLGEQVREVEEQTRQHSLSSSTQNGRINIAHAKKKKRLDEEFERLLGNIEQKRMVISELDDQATEKARERDLKEAEMIDVEKQLVKILVEQQKKVLQLVEQGKNVNAKGRDLLLKAKMPWPPPVNPDTAYVTALFA
jgi:hypothetical protein